MEQSKPTALWAVPRSISTAFERVFVERGDFKVFHEPFSASYYYSTERRSDRFAGEEPKAEYGYAEVLARILSPSEKPVFFKDMAYHAASLLSRDFAARFANTFIIRDPRFVLVSLYKFWPDFTFEESGYERLHDLFQYATEEGQKAVVVDATDFLNDPEGIVAAYCETLGIPFVPEALSWEPREVPEWQIWSEWHEDAEKSTGIKRQLVEQKPEIPEGLEEVYSRCLPYYEALHAERLRA
ncbi:MAG: sulfotransferase family protein [Actinomycetota bacterium]|nr:sulfotransferase family protein [Actinomycetota bacterium]